MRVQMTYYQNVLFYGQNNSRVLYIAFRKFALKAFDSVIPGNQSVQAPFLTQYAIFMNSEWFIM